MVEVTVLLSVAGRSEELIELRRLSYKDGIGAEGWKRPEYIYMLDIGTFAWDTNTNLHKPTSM